LREKGGEQHEVPVHHNAEAYVDAYPDTAGLAQEKKTPLFRPIGRQRPIAAPMPPTPCPETSPNPEPSEPRLYGPSVRRRMPVAGECL
jgi:hypothetical protein